MGNRVVSLSSTREEMRKCSNRAAECKNGVFAEEALTRKEEKWHRYTRKKS